jgi:hypothetical protein
MGITTMSQKSCSGSSSQQQQQQTGGVEYMAYLSI